MSIDTITDIETVFLNPNDPCAGKHCNVNGWCKEHRKFCHIAKTLCIPKKPKVLLSPEVQLDRNKKNREKKKLLSGDKRKPNARKVLCLSTGVPYDSIDEACRETKCGRHKIVKCCDGSIPDVNGTKFAWA